MDKEGKIWYCKVGFGPRDIELSDQDMRDGVEQVFKQLTGRKFDFVFSGWGAKLHEKELAVVEDRDPDPKLCPLWYVLQKPNGQLMPNTIAGTREAVWSKAIDPLVVLHGHDPIEMEKELVEAGYEVVIIEPVVVKDD